MQQMQFISGKFARTKCLLHCTDPTLVLRMNEIEAFTQKVRLTRRLVSRKNQNPVIVIIVPERS
jgi:hypothetical protein